MDKLTQIANVAWVQLPTCTACHSTLAQTEVYSFFSCFHFVCMNCASRGTTSCSCPNNQALAVVMPELREWQQKLRDTAERFYTRQEGGAFPELMQSCYELLRIVNAGQAVQAGPSNQQYCVGAGSQGGMVRSEREEVVNQGQARTIAEQQFYRANQVPPVSAVPQTLPAFQLPNAHQLPSVSNRTAWSCPKCNNGVQYPATQTCCSLCPYVNLGSVDTLFSTWTCVCSKVNSEDERECGNCRRPKDGFPVPIPIPPPNPSLWKCSCGYEYNQKPAPCTMCRRPFADSVPHQPEERKVPPQPEERKVPPAPFPSAILWTCRSCGYPYNQKTTSNCQICKAYNLEYAGSAEKAKVPTMTSPWTCASCRFNLNYRADVCSKCEQPRNELVLPPPVVEPKADPKANPKPQQGQEYPAEYYNLSKNQKKKWRKEHKK